MIWYINDKIAAAAGAANLHLTRRSGDVDRLTFDLAAAFDATVAYPYGTPVTLRRDNTVYFQGIVTSNPVYGTDSSEGHRVEVSGPWWWLDNIVYQQAWPKLPSGTITKTRAILGQAADGTSLRTDQVIYDALLWAIGSGALIGPGTMNEGPIPPAGEIVDMTCAEIIRRMLLFTPDWITWFDYSTTPPALHIRRRADLQVVQADVGAGNVVEAFTLSPRPDLQPNGVVIKYEFLNVSDGQHVLSNLVDKWPSDVVERTPGVMITTAELAGVSFTTRQQEKIVSEDLDDFSQLASWSKVYGWLKDKGTFSDTRITDIVITGLNRWKYNANHQLVTGANTALTLRLVQGRLHDWMRDAEGQSFVSEEQCVTCLVAYSKYNGSVHVEDVKYQLLAFSFIATNCPSGTYDNTVTISNVETPPSGLAQSIYEAMAALQFSGNVTIGQVECGGEARVGRVLNLLNGRSEWATMLALILQSDEDLESGATHLTIGPSRNIGLHDMVDRLRFNRIRRPAASWLRRTDPAASPSTVAASGPIPATVPTCGLGRATPYGAEQYQVYAFDGEDWAPDYVRAHGS